MPAAQATEVVEQFRAQGYEPLGTRSSAYATVQVWAQAVEAAGSLDLDPVLEAMHSRQFDTVLGRIGFDAEGRRHGLRAVAMVRLAGGRTYVPLEPSVAKEL